MKKNDGKGSKRKIITAVIVILIIVGLFWFAQVLTANFNILEILKKIHGG